MKKKQPGKWKHVHFRVPPAMIPDIEFLMKAARCETAGEYFRFLIRQELRSVRITVLPPQNQK